MKTFFSGTKACHSVPVHNRLGKQYISNLRFLCWFSQTLLILSFKIYHHFSIMYTMILFNNKMSCVVYTTSNIKVIS